MKAHRKQISSMIVAMGLLITSCSWAVDVYRDFTDAQGRTIKGQLIDFDHVKEVVTILREGREKPCRVPVSILCPEDQEYIHAWHYVCDFNDALSISSRLKEYSATKEDCGTKYNSDVLKRLGFEVQLANRSDKSFTGVEIEYCVFYHQGERSGDSIIFYEGVQCGRFTIESMVPGSTHDLTTETVLLHDESGPVTQFGRTGEYLGEVVGLWLRVHATLPSGERCVRELCSPESLAGCKDWTTTTTVAGLNRSSVPKVVPQTGAMQVRLTSTARFYME